MAQILSDPPVIKTVYGPASDLRQAIARMEVQTTGRGMVDITAPIDRWLASIKAVEGLLTLLLRHTSASLTIQENSDGNARADLMDAYDRLVPEGQTVAALAGGAGRYAGPREERADRVHLSVPVVHGRVDLGTCRDSTCSNTAPPRTAAGSPCTISEVESGCRRARPPASCEGWRGEPWMRREPVRRGGRPAVFRATLVVPDRPSSKALIALFDSTAAGVDARRVHGDRQRAGPARCGVAALAVFSWCPRPC